LWPQLSDYSARFCTRAVTQTVGGSPLRSDQLSPWSYLTLGNAPFRCTTNTTFPDRRSRRSTKTEPKVEQPTLRPTQRAASGPLAPRTRNDSRAAKAASGLACGLRAGRKSAPYMGGHMIRIAISQAAFDAIVATMPLGSVGYENEVNEKGERLVWLAPNVVDRLASMRGPGESYSDVILRLANELTSLSARVESTNAAAPDRWAPNFGRAGRSACDHAGRPPSYATGPFRASGRLLSAASSGLIKSAEIFAPVYVAEFEFRYNNRGNPDIFSAAIGRC
jgi:hypothetical protein